MDLDHCGAMMTLLQGVDIDGDTFGRDAYRETGPGENFLSTAHTLRHYATANFEPAIAEAGAFETWSETGAQTSDQRATARWQHMLADFEPPPLDRTIQSELADFVRERKNATPDTWH